VSSWEMGEIEEDEEFEDREGCRIVSRSGYDELELFWEDEDMLVIRVFNVSCCWWRSRYLWRLTARSGDFWVGLAMIVIFALY